jgi:hypothetical protein
MNTRVDTLHDGTFQWIQVHKTGNWTVSPEFGAFGIVPIFYSIGEFQD